jgi:hypothetical protein
VSENFNLPLSERMRQGALAPMKPYIRPVLSVAFVLAGMLWYITADAGEYNTTMFRPPDVHRTPQSVPEPGTLGVLAAGAAAAWFVRRRRKP